MNTFVTAEAGKTSIDTFTKRYNLLNAPIIYKVGGVIILRAIERDENSQFTTMADI